MIRRICIFDFDGTLFKSPEEPSWWHHPGWWNDPASLREPCVPSEPGDDWWVTSTVEAAKAANEAEDTYVVLLTGRKAGVFDARVRALLRQRGLKFDEIGLTTGDDSQAYKVSQIRRLIKEHPEAEEVEMWEDRPEQIRPFRATVEEAGLEYKVHRVRSDAKPVQCVEQDDRLVEKVARRWCMLRAR